MRYIIYVSIMVNPLSFLCIMLFYGFFPFSLYIYIIIMHSPLQNDELQLDSCSLVIPLTYLRII